MTARRSPIRGVVLGEAHEVQLREQPNRLSVLTAGSAQALAAMAEAEANAIVAEAEMARERAVEDGWREGYEAGIGEARARMSDAVAATAGMLSAMEEELAALPERLAQEVAAVALETAARIIRAELAVRPERVVDVARGAIRRATDRDRLLAHVNPADLAVMREATAGLVDQMGGIHRFDVIEDPRIAPGGCVLETPSGDVDARIESQLSRILEGLSAPPDGEIIDHP